MSDGALVTTIASETRIVGGSSAIFRERGNLGSDSCAKRQAAQLTG